MAWFAGIDVGSATTKAVVLDERHAVAGRGLVRSGADFAAAARSAYRQALAEANAPAQRVAEVVATGYGRSNAQHATARRTEIDCHARGAYHHFPRAITVVDIGGQDNKIIELDDAGRRTHFSFNRKCAAGTGSFLEEIGLRLQIPIEQLSEMAAQSTDHTVAIGSYCTVFAMTEVLGKIRAGVRPADLARAALVSVAKRVLESHAFSHAVVATGGVVAHNPLMREILQATLGTEVHLPPYPQHIGALGAALTAAQATFEETPNG